MINLVITLLIAIMIVITILIKNGDDIYVIENQTGCNTDIDNDSDRIW